MACLKFSHGEGERVMALESREGTRASRRVEEGLSKSLLEGGPLGLALGSPIFPSGCEGKLGVALESLQGLRDLT